MMDTSVAMALCRGAVGLVTYIKIKSINPALSQLRNVARMSSLEDVKLISLFNSKAMMSESLVTQPLYSEVCRQGCKSISHILILLRFNQLSSAKRIIELFLAYLLPTLDSFYHLFANYSLHDPLIYS